MMKELEIRPTKTAITWASIAFFIIVLFIYGFYFLGIDQKSPINYLSYLPFLACLFLAVRFHKETELGGFISFKRAFGTGFRFSSFLSLLMGVFMYTYMKWLNPDVLTQSLLEAENKMLDGGSSSDQIEMAMDISRNWGPLIAGITTTIMYTLSGVVVSLIVAAILKREEPFFTTEEEAE
jgi:hypothetical protein